MHKNITKQQLIDALELEGHVEGGYFKQTYKADNGLTISTENGFRTTMTSIYYLLTSESPIGHFHLNRSDIMHYFHAGDPITYFLILPDGKLEVHVLGSDVVNGQKLQLLVKGGTWKASRIEDAELGYGLIGEAVAPGFEYQDMTLGKAQQLINEFPQHEHLIRKHTRD